MSFSRSSKNAISIMNVKLERRTANHGREFDGREPRNQIFRRDGGGEIERNCKFCAVQSHAREYAIWHASQRPRTVKRKKGQDKQAQSRFIPISINRHLHRHLSQRHPPLTSPVSLFALSLLQHLLSSWIRVFLQDDQHGVPAADAVGSCVVQVTEPCGSLWLLRLHAR